MIVFYLCTFSGGLSNDQAVWGQFADYVGGLINPVISLVSLAAVLMALRGSIVALDGTRRQLQAQMFAESEGHFVSLEQMLASVPSALKFHGVDPEELNKAGITSAEFAYLLSNFTAGGINVRALQVEDVSPFSEGDYYKRMLDSPQTRKAWPILSPFISQSPYKQRIEATIRLIEEKTAAKTVSETPNPAMQADT